ncbi:hypothetical protein [Tolypothrix sp. VBCCA 56010]|uniref:hypothetical protein n=1 Tax=Tolypothrix sp. VBCCA 56010 TaxID=3137731 RepID=UPI003D7CBDB5
MPFGRQVLQRREPPFGFATSTGTPVRSTRGTRARGWLGKPTPPSGLTATHCLPNSQCPMPNAHCPMPIAQCPMPNAQQLSTIN